MVNSPLAYFLMGFVIGLFLVVEIYRSDWFARKRKDAYYDEFLFELSKLDEKGLEMLIEQFRNAHKIFKEKDVFGDKPDQ